MIYDYNHQIDNNSDNIEQHDHLKSSNHSHNHIHSHEHGHIHPHKKTKLILNRFSKAIGHLTAVKGMVEDGRDCSEVLIQLVAVRSAINGICEVILQDHIENCVVDAISNDDISTLEELKTAISILIKK